MKHKAKLALAGLAATTVLLWSTEGQAQNKPSGQFKGQETAKETIISKEKAKSTATWKPNAVRSTVERIYIEEESMASAKKYADCYRGLVDSIVDILKNDLKIKPSQPDRFMKGISEVILGMGIDRITNSYGLMSTFIDLRGGACTNFSALVSDAAREMGMPAEYVIIRSQNGRQQHMVAKVGNYVYDILADAPCKFENLKKKYGDNVILVTSNPKIMVNIGYENKGYALLAKEDYSGAIKAFDKAIELWGNSPCSSLSHIGKGNAYYGNKDYANAIASYKQAFAKDSKCTDALINIGNVYSITGEHQNAINEYKKAMKIAPFYLEIYQLLADEYMKIGNPGMAAWMLKLGKQKAAELKLDQSRATQYYGDISQAPTGSQVKVDYSQNIKHMPQKK